MLEKDEFRQMLDGSQMVLAGLGEEFECSSYLKEQPRYMQILEELQEEQYIWILPYIQYLFLRDYRPLGKALTKLRDLLADKNYFLLTTCMHGVLEDIGFKAERMVSPCGSWRKLQCRVGNCTGMKNVTLEFLEEIEAYIQEKIRLHDICLPRCPDCGSDLHFNSLYSENYNEAGYREQWGMYMKWLQGTLNRKLCVLELGVSLKFPTVIRFPFEKTAFFNRKAQFIRVHEKLYQLSEELADKGISQPENAVNFLNRI